jgi:conjugative relaxase-like TrwC/TraI family protein
VLSIGKLVAGQERYYQAQIVRGLDDYYAGRGEAPGRWVGAGAANLGLEGRVEEAQLQALIAGRDPRSGRVLRERETRVAALDLTFSAPKSVSVLFAVAPPEVSRALVECHEEAVEAALSYLEETAAFVSAVGTVRGLNGRPGSCRRRLGTGCRGRWIRSCTRIA